MPDTYTLVRPIAAAAMLLLSGCSDDRSSLNGPGTALPNPAGCSIPPSQIFSGGPGKDGIPALTNPELVGPSDAGASYLREFDRVIGLDLDGERVAVPLNIGWWHEIVNMQIGGVNVAVTHCPLTGSSLVFDRGPLADVEFGVSGLLYQNNLIMYDRSSGESLWPQMSRSARCGSQVGTALAMVPSIETTWAVWKTLHPETRVVSSNTAHPRDYLLYPYGNYDEPTNRALLFPLPRGIDSRRPPKERVLGIPESVDGDEGGVAFPFGLLRDIGDVAVVEASAGGRDVVVFWNGAASGAMAYETELDDGTRLSFRVEGTRIVDAETGSVWRLDGRSIEGPLASRRLRAVAEAHVAFWFAWAAFHPFTRVWPET